MLICLNICMSICIKAPNSASQANPLKGLCAYAWPLA